MTTEAETRVCERCGKEKDLSCFTHSDGSEEPWCFACRMKFVFVGKPRDFATRTWSKTPPATPANSWEAGTPVDERGMPYLAGDDMHDVQSKEFAEKKHLIEKKKREWHSVPPPEWARR